MKGRSWIKTSMSRARSLADIEVCCDMPLDLCFASTESDEHAEGKKLTHGHVDTCARVVVPKAVGGQNALDVQIIVGRDGVELVNDVTPDDLPLDRKVCASCVS